MLPKSVLKIVLLSRRILANNECFRLSYNTWKLTLPAKLQPYHVLKLWLLNNIHTTKKGTHKLNVYSCCLPEVNVANIVPLYTFTLVFLVEKIY